jgi:hypothetical protein
MLQPQRLPESQTLQERPTCEHCGSRMWLTRIAPDIEDHECRIFECPVCKQAEAKIIKFR